MHRRGAHVLIFFLFVVGCSIVAPVRVNAGSVTPLSPVTDADGRLGLCDVLPGPVPGSGAGMSWAQLAYQAGARVNRWEFRWDRLERQKGVWDFSSTDSAVSESVAAKLDVLGILIGTPSWAVGVNQKPGNGVPQGLEFPVTDPRNVWAAYVRRTVGHYAGAVRYWEIWNEPDLPYYWSGTPDSYNRLLTVAYRTIKDVDPQATVLVAGMVSPGMSFLTRLLAAQRSGSKPNGRKDFDALSWHAYAPARSLYDNVRRIRALLAENHLGDVPVWVTEDGIPSSRPGGEPRQAAYIQQTVAYALAAGAARVLVYRASDYPNPETWGLVTSTGSIRMAFVSFQVAASIFAHAADVVYAPNSSHERFSVYRPGQRIAMMWNRDLAPKTVDVTASTPDPSILDWQGQKVNATVKNGRIPVLLPGAQYNAGVDPSGATVGGPPRFLLFNNVTSMPLPSTQVFAGVSGGKRRIVLFNSSSVSIAIDIVATGRSVDHEVVQLQPRAVMNVDLDALAGPSYTGPIHVKAEHPVAVESISDSGVQQPLAPARTWYVPSVPGTIAVTNTSSRQGSVALIAYGRLGRARAWWQPPIAPHASLQWRVRSLVSGDGVALSLNSTVPVVVSSVSGHPIPAVPSGSRAWYVLRPRQRDVTVFNPDPATTALVTVRHIRRDGSSVLRLAVAPHASEIINGQSAKAMVLSSGQDITAAYASPRSGDSRLQTSAVPRADFALGRDEIVHVFNPSNVSAHVSISRTANGTTTVETQVLAPSALATSVTRVQSGAAGSVTVASDVPVVVAGQ
ncbi:MAG: hypothetical protein PVSMB7_02200 [Chloroflexota bacterium]